MFRVDPTGRHEERAEENKGNHGGKQEKRSTDKESITRVLDHRKQKVTHDPKSTRVEDTKGTILLRTEVLIVFP